MRRYIFRVYTASDPYDGFSVWVEAASDAQAWNQIRRGCWLATRIDLLSVKER